MRSYVLIGPLDIVLGRPVTDRSSLEPYVMEGLYEIVELDVDYEKTDESEELLERLDQVIEDNQILNAHFSFTTKFWEKSHDDRIRAVIEYLDLDHPNLGEENTELDSHLLD